MAKKISPSHSRARPDGGNAFIPDPQEGPAHTNDALAEDLAESFLESATSGEEQGEERHEQVVSEERGGPFVPSSGDEEFARGVDRSNPVGAEKAPFPVTQGTKKPRRVR